MVRRLIVRENGFLVNHVGWLYYSYNNITAIYSRRPARDLWSLNRLPIHWPPKKAIFNYGTMLIVKTVSRFVRRFSLGTRSLVSVGFLARCPCGCKYYYHRFGTVVSGDVGRYSWMLVLAAYRVEVTAG